MVWFAVQEVDDKRRKAIKKIVDKEDKARAPIVKKAAADAGYLGGLRAKVQALEEEVAALNAGLSGSL